MDSIKKIPIKPLIDLLTSLYNAGLDYVDITGRPSEDPSMHVITVSIEKDYMNKDYQEAMEDNSDDEISDAEDSIPEDSNIKLENKLSDTDVNDLLNQ